MLPEESILTFLHSQKSWQPYLRFDLNLRKKTSFQCDVKASACFQPINRELLAECIQTLDSQGFVYQRDFHVLGRGSNVLFEDGGYKGCLIDLSRFQKIQTVVKDRQWVLDVESGVGMGTLLQQLRKESYTGFEFVFGIPGSVGGGIRMNAGTPDGWFSNVLTEVFGYDQKGLFFSKQVTEKDFLYRDFPWGKDKIIAGGRFVFEKSDARTIEEKIASAKSKRDRQPLAYPNFGSVFKNPPTTHAGFLIQEVGLKGHQIGEAQISSMHANFIINHGLAKTSDVKKLIDLARKKVFDEKGIVMETEVHLLGEENGS